MKTNPTVNLSFPKARFMGLSICLLVAALAGATAQDLVRYEAVPGGSSCAIDGTSSIHDWTMTSKIISGYIEADPGFPESALAGGAAASPTVVANLPAATYRSGNSAQDKNMQKAVKADKHPRFEYRLISLKPKSQPGATGPLEFDATGTLAIAGKTVTNTFPVTIEKKEGKLTIAGSTPIKLSDFDIQPPTINLVVTTIKVGNDLKIKFEWTLAEKKKAS
ncbi:MAG TPA: YceI family protein [Verrucomicrobiota bacterium]|nr:YceI family protein [Verrucomicrobiota bacterium]HNT15022.1 YceI family protein [Verrucomicrobiota bacterium]